MALSRRSLLCGLLAAPAVVYAGHLMPIRGVKLIPERTRGAWKTILEPDGSTTLVNGQKRWLQTWIDSGDFKYWGSESHPDFGYADYNQPLRAPKPSLEDMRGIIEYDIKAVEERSSHWRDFQAFQREEGVTVEAKITVPGAYLKDRGDVIPPPHKAWSAPVFQFYEKDW